MYTFERFDLQPDHPWMPQVVQYVNEAVQPANPWGDQEVCAEFDDPLCSLYGLAVDSSMVAFGALYGPSATRWVSLEYLAVAPSLRGQGFGSAMLGALEHAARRLGADEMWVAPLSEPRVVRFYEDRDYKRQQIDRDDPDGWRMVKNLRSLGSAGLRS